jgi:hypothetical protein
MTDEDKRGFVQAFNRLAVATRLADSDATMQRVYFDGLSDLDIDAVEGAAALLAKSAQWFPKVSEWRDAARIAQVATIKALPPGRDVPWEDECGACGDSGWEERRCYPGTRNTCGRKKCELERAEHRYTVPCTCRPTNRTYARHHLGTHAVYAE